MVIAEIPKISLQLHAVDLYDQIAEVVVSVVIIKLFHFLRWSISKNEVRLLSPM